MQRYFSENYAEKRLKHLRKGMSLFMCDLFRASRLHTLLTQRAHTHTSHTLTRTHTHACTHTSHTLAHKLEQRCQNTCNSCVFYKIFCTLLTNRLRPFGDFNHHTVTSSNHPPSAHQRLSSLSLSVLVIMFVFFSDSFKCFHTTDMFPRLYLIASHHWLCLQANK